jgi:hypothetical protein
MVKNDSSLQTYQRIQAEYRDLDPGFQQIVRIASARDLRIQGLDETDSSTITANIYALYQQLGGFVAIMQYGLALTKSQA